VKPAQISIKIKVCLIHGDQIVERGKAKNPTGGGRKTGEKRAKERNKQKVFATTFHQNDKKGAGIKGKKKGISQDEDRTGGGWGCPLPITNKVALKLPK